MDDLRRDLEFLLEGGSSAIEPIQTTRLVVYGAGGCGRRVAAQAREKGLKVCAFIDAGANGAAKKDGIQLLHPDSQTARDLARAGVPVVIGIFNYATDLAPIRALLRRLGFKRIISYLEFHEQFGEADDFWLTKRAFYAGKANEVVDGFNLFADEVSRQIFRETLAFRLTSDPNLLQTPEPANQYLPADLPPPPSPIRLIDAGAFTGDTLGMFADRSLKLDAVAAFEPDAENYRQLCQRVAELADRLGNVTLFPCGIGARTEMQSFHSGDGSGSAIVRGGSTNIQVVALDDVLPTFAPNFIKMDIEGAEPEALKGAAKMLQRHQPRLAVSVYHKPEHLWTIPQLMHELLPSSRLALRYHQWNGFDLVAYAFQP